MPVVDRRLIDAAPPHGVVRDVVEAREDVARELMRERKDALGRQATAVLVHGGKGGDYLVHELDLVVAHVARGVVVRNAVQELPQERRPVVGVACQQLVQQCGAGAPEAGHDDRAVDGLAENGGFLLPEVDHAQSVLEDQLKFAARCAAGRAGADAPRRRGRSRAGRRAPPTRCRRSRRGRSCWWRHCARHLLAARPVIVRYRRGRGRA